MSENSSSKNIHAGHRERVKNGVAEHGFQQLEDHKLLELLLFYSIPREDTNELAHRLLNEFGGISGVLNADYDELLQVKGVGKNTALMLSCVSEFNRRGVRQKLSRKKRYESFEELAALAKSLYTNETRERVFLLCLDKAKQLKRVHELTEGDETTALLDKALIARIAAQSNCRYNILVHNHPLTDSSPSASDIDTTRSVAVMLRNMGFALADHLIVGADGDVFSMFRDPKFNTFLL